MPSQEDIMVVLRDISERVRRVEQLILELGEFINNDLVDEIVGAIFEELGGEELAEEEDAV